MSWTATSNNMISNFDYAAGDYSSYESISITVSGLSNAAGIRLQVRANGQEKLVPLNGEGNFTKKLVSDFGFTESDLKSVEWVRVLGSAWQNDESHTIDAEHPASAVISDVYMEKPTTLDFDAFGKGSMPKSDLTATGGLTYNPSTGVLTSDGTAGTMVLEFATPVDLSYLIHYEVKREGTSDIISRLKFYDEDESLINTWNSIKLDNNWQMPGGIDDNATNAFLNNKPVKKMVWESDANASNNGKTLTINSVNFELKTISCAKAGETQLNTLPWIRISSGAAETPDWNMNVETDTYYGNYSSDPDHYVDLTAYEELRIYRDNNTGFRAFFINASGAASNTINHENAASSWNDTEKYWSIDLSKIEKWDSKVALKSIKSASSGTKNIVKNIVVYSTPAANAPQYILTGSGMQLAETVAALADATATCIDATGVTGITTNSEKGRTLLESANANCLFLGKVGNGYLSNTKNVVDGDACANLELTDGNYSFKAPAEFTATTSVSYDRTLTEGKTTTVCLPFALSAEEAATMGKFYALTNLADETLTFTRDEDEISANTPYLFVPATTAFADYASKTIAATPASIKTSVTGVEFIGTLASTTIPASDGSTDYYAFNNGDLVKIETKAATLPAFRGYFKVTSGGGARLATLFIEDSLTGINEVSNSEDIKAVNNFEGKVFENGKIVIFKKGMKFNAAGAQIK